jgi:agmatine deiminase
VHIDNLARFVNADTVLALTEPDPADVNYRPLADNFERLQAHRGPRGERLHVVPLLEPEPLFHGGRRLPASYANFYIGNAVVLVPCFGGARDAAALAQIGVYFPQRRVVGIDSRVVVRGNGGWHCLTQQILAARTA